MRAFNVVSKLAEHCRLDPVAFAVRDGQRVAGLADTCAHASAPLHQGELELAAGETCLRCPWHGSVFRLTDGAVVQGPATMPQPGFDTRVVDGRVQVNVRRYAGVASAG